ncbi:hypothetical protein GAMM_40318 [Gammaproteobacteria bacterium]
MQTRIIRTDSTGEIIGITERAVCTEYEIRKQILDELKNPTTKKELQCPLYAETYMKLRKQLLEEKKELVRLQKEKKELSNTKDSFIKLTKAQEVLFDLRKAQEKGKKKKLSLNEQLDKSIEDKDKLKDAKDEVDRLSKLVENQERPEEKTIDKLDKSIKEQTKKVDNAKEACTEYEEKYHQKAREYLKKKKEKPKDGQENIYSKRDDIYNNVTNEAKYRTETRKAILKQQREVFKQQRELRAKQLKAEKKEAKRLKKQPPPKTPKEKEARKIIKKAAKEKEHLEEETQDFLANLPKVLNTALETAIDAQKKGAFIGVLANLGGILSAANIGLDFKNILEGELHIPSIGDLAKADPNLIVQSNAVGKLLTSELTWDAIRLVLPKLLDVIERYQTEIDDGIWSVINEKPSIDINDKSKMLLAKLILGNKQALDVIIEIVSGAGTDVILDFLRNSATLAPYIESSGVSSDNIDKVVRSLISILPFLLNSNQKLLALISTETSLEEKIKNGLLIAKNEELIGGLSQLVSTFVGPVIAEVLAKYNKELNPFKLNPVDVQPLVQGVLTFVSGVIKKLPQIATLLEKHIGLLSSIIGHGSLTELKKLTAEDQAKLIDDVFSIIKAMDPVTLLQNKEALQTVVGGLIHSPFFKANVLDKITKALGLGTPDKVEAQTKVQSLITDLITDTLPVVLEAASLLLKQETLGKIQKIVTQALPLLSATATDKEKEKAMSEIMSSALSLLAEKEGVVAIVEQILPIVSKHAESIVATVLETNPEILAHFGQGKDEKDKQAINLLVKSGVKFISEALKKAPQVIAILREHSEIYSALMNSAVVSGMHGFSLAGLLGVIKNEHLVVIADDVLSIIRAIDPATLLQEENKEALKTVASGFIQSPFFKEKVLDTIPKELKELGASDEAVKKLATEAVSIVLDAAGFLLEEKTLKTVQEIIEQVPLLLSKDEGKKADKEKVETMFKIVDSVFGLLADPKIGKVYTDGIIKLINDKDNCKVLKTIIQSQIDKSPLKGKVDLTAKNILDVISNPEALKVVQEAYELYRKGYTWRAIYTAVTGVMGSRVPELRKVALHIMYDLLTGLVFQEKIMPNFLRRWSVGSSINDAIKNVQTTNKKDGVKDLADILLKSKTSATGTVAKYSIENKFLSGLNFEDTKFSNLKIDGFNFNGATFGETSFANSIITETNFKDVNFKSKTLDFTNAIIDLNSLKTLAKFFKPPREIKYEDMKLLSPKIMPKDREELKSAGLDEKMLNEVVKNTRVSVLMELIKKELGGELSSEQKKNIELIVKVAGEDKFDKIAAPDMLKSFMSQLPKGIDALSSPKFNEGQISEALTKHFEIIERVNQPVKAIRLEM